MFIVHSRRTSSSRLYVLTVHGRRICDTRCERAFNGRMSEWMDVRWVVDTQDVNNRASTQPSQDGMYSMSSRKTRKMNAFNDDDNVVNEWAGCVPLTQMLFRFRGNENTTNKIRNRNGLTASHFMFYESKSSANYSFRVLSFYYILLHFKIMQVHSESVGCGSRLLSHFMKFTRSARNAQLFVGHPLPRRRHRCRNWLTTSPSNGLLWVSSENGCRKVSTASGSDTNAILIHLFLLLISIRTAQRRWVEVDSIFSVSMVNPFCGSVRIQNGVRSWLAVCVLAKWISHIIFAIVQCDRHIECAALLRLTIASHSICLFERVWATHSS